MQHTRIPTRAAEPLDSPPSWRRVVRQIERHFLGFDAEPLDDRLRNAGWSTEPRDRVCPRCARTVGAFGADEDGCADCRGTRPAWNRVVRLGVYEGVLGEIVRDVKFNRFRTLGARIGFMLGDHLRSRLVETGLDPAAIAIVPLPMSRRRFLERGIDHALTISRGLRTATGGTIVRILSRYHGPTQLAVPASDRRSNVSKVFRVRNSVRPPRSVSCWVIVDDVRTTGASLQSAARVLRKYLESKAQETGADLAWRAPIWGGIVASADEP